MRAQKELITRGKLVGNAPWGYEIAGEKYDKTIVPTDLGRKVIPEIFSRCINGQSLADIAEWLDSEGIPTAKGGSWHAKESLRSSETACTWVTVAMQQARSS